MNLLFWGLTIGMIGKVMVAAGVLIAHSELAHEKRVDKRVLKSFRTELILTLAGLLFIIGGYIMEISFYEIDTSLLTCRGADCAAAMPATQYLQ
jgi:NhaP-type Na+/H+ or K+/H+ antiporter